MTSWDELVGALREKFPAATEGEGELRVGTAVLRRRVALDRVWVHVAAPVCHAGEIALHDLMCRNAVLPIGGFAVEGAQCVFQAPLCLDAVALATVLKTIRWVSEQAAEWRAQTLRGEHPYGRLYAEESDRWA